ncbi:MAG: YXWGXW repeat-containing protein [Caldimonas sp.]
MSTIFKRLAVIAAATASLAVLAPVTQAADVFVRIAPPAPRTEVVPAARRGYVWTPGYWNWNGRRYVWSRGVWARERRGYVYNAPVWEQDGSRWRLRRGAWGRGDRDHDGIPNRFDNHPNNPRRP